MKQTSVKIGLALGLVTVSLLVSQGIERSTDSLGIPQFVDRHALAQGDGKILNVMEFGARGDGVSDDTAAIQKTINAAPERSTIYFPAGTYDVSNLSVKNRSALSFMGDERKSVIRQKTGAARIATFEKSSDIVITKLAFDANGIHSYGGVVFYAAKGVLIENNSFIDSAPKHNRAGDHYSFVFGKGAEPSQNIKILNNTIEYLQLEVDHSRNVVIEGNTVKGSIGTSGIGVFTVGNDAIAEDYLIKGNTVIDPPGAGFHVVTDPPSSRNCVFRRITIVGNRLIRTNTQGYGIRIGTLNNSKAASGNVFEDIAIKDNLIRIEATAPATRQLVFANSSHAAGILFNRLTVTGNTIENEAPGNSGFAIDLKRIQNSVVAENTIKGVANGIALAGELLANEVRNNVVTASGVAYRFDSSRGKNRAVNNRILGNPKQGWKLSNMNPSDSIEP
ncbi:MAG: glycosyl hydrolase family 28-related protein [Candidatus Binatia bacterium]